MKNIIKVFLINVVVLFVSCEKKNDKTALNKMAKLPNSLKEISGVAYHNDFIYAIEDSGNDNEITVVDTLGNIVRKI